MELAVLFTILLLTCVLAPFLGADTRRMETLTHRGALTDRPAPTGGRRRH